VLARLKSLFDTRVRRILRDSSWMLSATAFSVVFGMVQVLLVTRLLGPDLYGRVTLIITISQTVKLFLGIRLWEWAMKELAKAHTAGDAAHAGHVMRRGYRLGFLINAAAFVIVVASSPFTAARVLKDPAAWIWIAAYAVVLLVSWSSDPAFALLRVTGRFKLLALQQAVMAVLRVIVIGGSVLVWRRLDTTVAAYLAIEVILAVWLQLAASRAFHDTFAVSWWQAPRLATSGPPMVRLVAIGTIIDTLKVVAGRFDLLVLGWYANPFLVANYQAAANFLDVAQRVTQPVTMVVFADFAKLGAAGQRREIVGVVGKLSVIALLVTLPVCGAIVLLAPWLCDLVYGAQYPHAPALLQALAFSLTWLTGLWMLPSFVSLGKPGWGLEVVAVNTAVKVALLFALVPGRGAMGVAIANLASCLSVPLLIPLYWWRMKRLVTTP
jgi:O-antigen/teichoic acid export membrane protein